MNENQRVACTSECCCTGVQSEGETETTPEIQHLKTCSAVLEWGLQILKGSWFKARGFHWPAVHWPWRSNRNVFTNGNPQKRGFPCTICQKTLENVSRKIRINEEKALQSRQRLQHRGEPRRALQTDEGSPEPPVSCRRTGQGSAPEQQVKGLQADSHRP